MSRKDPLENEPPTNASEGARWQIRDPTETIHKSRLTIFCLSLLLIGLVLGMVATVASVKTEQSGWNVTKRISTTEQSDKPVTLIRTKFRVPSTNTFDAFDASGPGIGYQDNVKIGMKFSKKVIIEKTTK